MNNPCVQQATRRGIDLETSLTKLADCGPAAIDERLEELADEWSAGRMSKAAAGALILGGLGLSIAGSRLFAALPALGGLALAQSAAGKKNWLSRLFTEMGYRTAAEIEREKVALRALRGDFRNLPTVHEVEDRDDISRLEGEGGIVIEPDNAKVDHREAVREVLQATGK